MKLLTEPSTGSSGAGFHHIQPYLVCQKKFQLANVRGISKPQTRIPEPFAVGAEFHPVAPSGWRVVAVPTPKPGRA